MLFFTKKVDIYQFTSFFYVFMLKYLNKMNNIYITKFYLDIIMKQILLLLSVFFLHVFPLHAQFTYVPDDNFERLFRPWDMIREH